MGYLEFHEPDSATDVSATYGYYRGPWFQIYSLTNVTDICISTKIHWMIH